jgi:hypothetical protein
MNHEFTSLYGELVIPFQLNNQSDLPDEAEVMEDTFRVMIEEAAYYLAEERGFKPGYELQDWLQAEKQIRK